MVHLRFEEIEKDPKKAMTLCSSAMRDAIRQYGFAAVVDFLVRISNYDPIVNDSLAFLPSIAIAEMLSASSTRLGSKIVTKSREDLFSETEPLIILASK